MSLFNLQMHVNDMKIVLYIIMLLFFRMMSYLYVSLLTILLEIMQGTEQKTACKRI